MHTQSNKNEAIVYVHEPLYHDQNYDNETKCEYYCNASLEYFLCLFYLVWFLQKHHNLYFVIFHIFIIQNDRWWYILYANTIGRSNLRYFFLFNWLNFDACTACSSRKLKFLSVNYKFRAVELTKIFRKW